MAEAKAGRQRGRRRGRGVGAVPVMVPRIAEAVAPPACGPVGVTSVGVVWAPSSARAMAWSGPVAYAQAIHNGTPPVSVTMRPGVKWPRQFSGAMLGDRIAPGINAGG